MKTSPSPLIILLFSFAAIYRGCVAFFPSLRGENKKKRKPVPKAQGVIYFLVGVLGVLYSLYVIYVFAGGTLRILSIDDEMLFRSADILLFAPIVLLFILSLLKKVFLGKKNDKED